MKIRQAVKLFRRAAGLSGARRPHKSHLDCYHAIKTIIARGRLDVETKKALAIMNAANARKGVQS